MEPVLLCLSTCRGRGVPAARKLMEAEDEGPASSTRVLQDSADSCGSPGDTSSSKCLSCDQRAQCQSSGWWGAGWWAQEGQRMLWGPLRWVSPSLWGYWALPTESLTLPQAAALCPHTAGGGTERLRGAAGWAPAPISQEMGLGCWEGDQCLLLSKGERLQLSRGYGGTRETRVRPRWGARGWAITGGLYGVCSTGCRVGP